ncbi:MAG: dihydrofolate reductase family protein [Eubacteriales bacterium]|nr:dihydrofolate reductase family protein [Eubacteriales bacterium]
MNKPYIICHMMTSVDGRIDCGMTEKLAGVKEYYEILEQLNLPTTVSGKVTARLEMAEAGEFIPQHYEAFGKEGFSKKTASDGYTVVTDSKGELLWGNAVENEMPLLIITSEQVSKEYLAYLDAQNISWIVCGEKKIDLIRASEILAAEFSVQRMGIVGGGTINAGFLDAGLLDEISMLVAPGIDGRGGMAASFDGLAMDKEPVCLQLESAVPYEDGAVWLRYRIK